MTKLAQIRFGTDNLVSELTQKFQSWDNFSDMAAVLTNYAQLGFRADNWNSVLKQNSKLTNKQKHWTFNNSTAKSTDLAKKVSEMTIKAQNWHQNFKVDQCIKKLFCNKNAVLTKNWNYSYNTDVTTNLCSN